MTAGAAGSALQNVGCDYEIDSHAVEDRCGVCHGDGSTCHTVHKTFEDSEGLGKGTSCCPHSTPGPAQWGCCCSFGGGGLIPAC